MSDTSRQLTLAKGSQRYIFRYVPGQEDRVLEAISTLASDPASGLDWFDAAVLSFKLARRVEGQLEHEPPAKAAG